MRIKVKFTPSTDSIDINKVQQKVNGYIHKCLGADNKYHDTASNYSISSLQGGKLNNGKLSFINGSYLIITSLDQVFISKMLSGIISNQEFIAGMTFDGVDNISETFYDGWNNFFTLSPFIIKDKVNKRFITLKDDDFIIKLKEYLINKLSKVNSELDLSDFDVEVKEHNNHKVKKIMVKNVFNFANQCQVSIKTNKKVAETLYNIGIGQSTGCGFGSICLTKNIKKYRI